MKKLFFSAVLIHGYFICQSQDNSTLNMLSFNFGLGHIARQDLIFSPFIHTDVTMLNFGMDYTRDANFYQKAHLHYANFNPMVAGPYEFTEYGEPHIASPHNFNFVDLDYLFGKRIKEFEKSNLIIGGLFTANIQAMNYVYGRFSNLGYYSALGLGGFAKYNYTLSEKSRLTASIQLPLMTWLSRSPYMVNDDQFIENISSHSGFKSFMAFVGDGNLVTWNKLQTFDFEAKYLYTLNTKWELGCAYNFEYIHSGEPRNLLSFRNALNLSANFKF